jgi:GNAT superfamily N-acetyltransferase
LIAILIKPTTGHSYQGGTNMKLRIKDPVLIEFFDPKKHLHHCEELDKLDALLLKEIKAYLKPMTSTRWHSESNQPPEEYWTEYNKNHPMLLAMVGGELVGYLVIGMETEWVDTASISAICLKPAVRKQGIARLLMHEAIEWMKTQKVKHVLYNTQIKNTNSRKLAARWGFDEFTVGHVKHL